MRLTTIAAAAAGALLLGSPALAEGDMKTGNPGMQPLTNSTSSQAGNTQSGETQDGNTMSQRCDRLAEHYREAEVQRGVEAEVLEAEVRHEAGVRACKGGNYAEGIEQIQQALREIGAPSDVTTNQPSGY